MEKTAELIKQITERLNRRPARIDKADRLWDAAVLVPLIDTTFIPRNPMNSRKFSCDVLDWR